MTLVLILAAGLMAVMAVVEWVNFRRTRRLTFLSAVHGLIALGYCLPPFLIAFLPDTAWQHGPSGPTYNPWGDRLYILDLADHLNLSPGAYVTEMIILAGGYVMIVSGYLAVARIARRPRALGVLATPMLLLGGIPLGLLAVAAMGVYAAQFDGLPHLLQAGVHIREGTLSVQRGYLQVLAQIGLPAFLLLVAAAARFCGWARAALLVLAALVWTCVGIRMLHTGGRLEMGAFLLAPLVGWVFTLRSQRLVAAAVLALAAIGLIVVSLPHEFFRHPILTLPTVLSSLAGNLAAHVLYFVSQYAFPHVAAAHTVTVVPDMIGFRHFIDIPLGALYMLPNLTGVESLPPMILSLHVKLLPWIPVDLFSFGYYSLGTVGVLTIFAGFGAVLAVFDGWLTDAAGWLGQALRAAWLFYLPFRLFYADPYAAAQSGFGLIAGTLVIALAAALSPRRP